MKLKVVWLKPKGAYSQKYKYYEDGDIYTAGTKIGRAQSLSDAIEIMKSHLGDPVEEVDVRDA